jgi:acyl-CoA synthetase (AMP-forming)/AMP-acid ligase II
MDISLYLPRAARYWADRTAILYGEREITFRELDRRANRLANALLGLGLRHGDRVAIQTLNRPQVVEVESALYKAGLVKVPVNARLSPVEVEELIDDSGAVAFIASKGHAGLLANAGTSLASVRHRFCLDGALDGWSEYESLLAAASDSMPVVHKSDTDIAVLHYTSGSTGRLKAAIQTYGNRHASLRNLLLGRPGGAPGPGDRMAMLGPMTHATGMLIQPFLSRGVTLCVFPRYDPEEFLEAVQRLKITHAFMVPTMVNMLLSHPKLTSYDLSSLRSLSYGGAPMSARNITAAWESIGPVLTQGYGAAETTGGIINFGVEDHQFALAHRPERLLTCGRPFGEAEVRVVNDHGEEVESDEIGEIVVRGANVFAGYWKAPELTEECLRNGWWHSGDLARVDDEGFIYIVDRKKDMIISGGFNIYTNEVEQALSRHPDVNEVCVYGIPDEKWGESVRATVVKKSGSELTDEALIAFCATQLADFKKPRSIEFLPDLPKNQNGKIARKVLRDRHWTAGDRKVS